MEPYALKCMLYPFFKRAINQHKIPRIANVTTDRGSMSVQGVENQRERAKTLLIGSGTYRRAAANAIPAPPTIAYCAPCVAAAPVDLLVARPVVLVSAVDWMVVVAAAEMTLLVKLALPVPVGFPPATAVGGKLATVPVRRGIVSVAVLGGVVLAWL